MVLNSQSSHEGIIEARRGNRSLETARCLAQCLIQRVLHLGTPNHFPIYSLGDSFSEAKGEETFYSILILENLPRAWPHYKK
jgi:hypothetical protein